MTIVFIKTGMRRVSSAPGGGVNHASSDRVQHPSLPAGRHSLGRVAPYGQHFADRPTGRRAGRRRRGGGSPQGRGPAARPQGPAEPVGPRHGRVRAARRPCLGGAGLARREGDGLASRRGPPSHGPGRRGRLGVPARCAARLRRARRRWPGCGSARRSRRSPGCTCWPRPDPWNPSMSGARSPEAARSLTALAAELRPETSGDGAGARRRGGRARRTAGRRAVRLGRRDRRAGRGPARARRTRAGPAVAGRRSKPGTWISVSRCTWRPRAATRPGPKKACRPGWRTAPRRSYSARASRWPCARRSCGAEAQPPSRHVPRRLPRPEAPGGSRCSERPPTPFNVSQRSTASRAGPTGRSPATSRRSRPARRRS